MKFTIVSNALALLLASTAFASPVPAGEESVAKRSCGGNLVTLAFSNDMTGTWVTRVFCIDNIAINLSAALQSSQLDRNGKILVSSMVMTSGLGNRPFCTVQDVNGDIWGPLTSQKTYLKFGTDPNKLSLLDMNTKRVQCSIDGDFKCGGIIGDAYTTCIKTGVRPN